MQLPWMYGPKQFDVTAGESSLVQLNVPYRGTLRTFSLQAAGGGAGTFEIYTSEDAANRAVAEGNGSSSSAAGDMPPSNYVIYNGTLVAGRCVAHDLEIPYVNRDGTPTNGVGRLWMRLTPDGGGDLEFVLGMGLDLWGGR